MTARDILAREAEAILLESGAVEARADHFGPWWRVYGRLASGDEHVGTTHLQADPQDPRDLARRLVVIMQRMRAAPEAVAAPAEAVQDSPVIQEGADHDTPVDANGEPTADPGTGNDSDAGEREMGDGLAAVDVPAGDAGQGVASDAAADGGGVGSEPGESGLVRSAVEGEDFAPEAEEPTDAEFSDAEFEHDSHAVELDDDDIPEMILIENDPNDIPVEEPVYAGPIEHGSPGGVVYFGDDIQVIKLAKMGRLAQIARALKDVLQEGWTLEEFSSLQNLIVRVDRGEMPYDHRAQMRWDEIGARSRTMGRIDKYKDDRELELDTLDRAGIEAFDPEEGWPE